MHLKTRNVNTAFSELVKLFDDGINNRQKREYLTATPIVRRSSRNGDVFMIEEPVTITYERPRERVLFNAARDCNPFFHLYEALWMLAGRNDLASMTYYLPAYGSFVGDDSQVNGAYGYRWRHTDYNYGTGSSSFRDLDQLAIIIDQLRRKPESRRVVLQMWNVEDDLLKIDTSKDVCCNTHVYFSIRGEEVRKEPLGSSAFNQTIRSYLDMTVCNRSNDLVLGMLGANYVHFSFLQEYLAAAIGVDVGRYHQVTNNLHVYEKTWQPDLWNTEGPHRVDYGLASKPSVLVNDSEMFEEELPKFVDLYGSKPKYPHAYDTIEFNEPFLQNVAKPVCESLYYHREKQFDRRDAFVDNIGSWDWQIAVREWFQRRARRDD